MLALRSYSLLPRLTRSINQTKFIPRITNNLFLRRAFSSNYNSFNYYYQPPRTPFYKKFLYVLGLGVVAGSVAYYFYWPKHTFPLSVAKILRKGLWAESDKGDFDFQLALKYYIEALKECDRLEIDKLTDEYTGIQLKIAEMFERLNMLDDAAFVYNEIAVLYLKVLTASPKSEDGQRIKSESHRAHLIQKDLRIAVKLVMLNEENYPLCKAILVTHLLIAQDLVQRRFGPNHTLAKLFEDARLPSVDGKAFNAASNEVKSSDIPSSQFSPIGGHKSEVFDTDGNVIGKISTNPMAWEPFALEFFGALDILMAVCLKMGDLRMATSIKTSANEWAMIAEMEPAQIMMSLCNLAALLYIEAGTYEEEALRLKKLPIRTPAEEQRLQVATQSRIDTITTSMKVYKFLVEYLKLLPQDMANKKEALEAVAMAVFGMGVINLHEGELDTAERLLREARVRSKQCGYDSLISLIETELGKLFKDRKKIQDRKDKDKNKVNDNTSSKTNDQTLSTDQMKIESSKDIPVIQDKKKMDDSLPEI